MDEAVAGHATRIEIELAAGDWLTVRDNGRGIPVDPHPRFPDKSALEIILTTLHSGGKFGGDAYKTSGGLHGVGVSVVNALSDALEVEVARDRRLWRQRYSRGRAPARRWRIAGRCKTGAARRALSSRPEIFGELGVPPGAALPHGALQGLSVPRPRNPLELRPVAAAARRRAGRGAAAFPGRPRRFSRGEPRRPGDADAAPVSRAGRSRRRRPGRMGGGVARGRGSGVQPLLLQHHPDARGRHPRSRAAQRAAARTQGLWRARPATGAPRRRPART